MKHHVHATDQLLDQRGIAHIAADELCPQSLEIDLIAGCQVVQHRDLMAVLAQELNDVRADESGAACDEALHGSRCLLMQSSAGR